MAGKTVPVVRSVPALRATLDAWRRTGDSVALIPTMGALHDGHLRLVEEGRRHCRRTVASIFVNPRQFAANEDLSRYPRDEAGDLAKLASVGCDLVWAPSPEAMYPAGFATAVVPAGAAAGLESDFRPHFFQGVATVCTKLFTQVAPEVAVFGEKDYQQLCVVRQIVRDLDLRLAIVGLPTVREPDGLAMSSRNRYLSAEERSRAPLIDRVIRKVAARVRAGEPIGAVTAEARRELEADGWRVDYVEVRDAVTLAVPAGGHQTGPLRVLAAAWLGSTRLIDNVAAG